MRLRLSGPGFVSACALALFVAGCGGSGGTRPAGLTGGSLLAFARHVNLRPSDLRGSSARANERIFSGVEETTFARCAGVPQPFSRERAVSRTLELESDDLTVRSFVRVPPRGEAAADLARDLGARRVGLSSQRGIACLTTLITLRERQLKLPASKESGRPLAGFPGATLALRFTDTTDPTDNGPAPQVTDINDVIEGVRGDAAFELQVTSSGLPLAGNYEKASPPPHALELSLYRTLARRLALAQGLAE